MKIIQNIEGLQNSCKMHTHHLGIEPKYEVRLIILILSKRNIVNSIFDMQWGITDCFDYASSLDVAAPSEYSLPTSLFIITRFYIKFQQPKSCKSSISTIT